MPRADIAIHSNQVVRLVTNEGVPVREDVLYTNDRGEEKRGIRKRNEKRVRKLLPALTRLLVPEEAVLFLAEAHSPLTMLEQLTAGWWTYYLSRSAVVVTNKRILFLPIKSNGTWKESVRSVQWGDVVEVKPKGWLVRYVTFAFRNGSKVTYTHFRRADAKKIAAIAAAVHTAGAAEQSASQGLAQLCPDCRSVLTAGVYSCSSCGLVFKNEKTMQWRSILLPGGGYFYTGHPLIAIVPAIVEVFLVLEIALLIAAGLHNPVVQKNLMATLILLAVIWVFETAITMLHCRRYVREFIPEKRDPNRAHMAASPGK